MDTDANSSSRLAAARRRADQRHRRRADVRRESLLGGETQGNERLTVITGLVLIVLLAAVGVTIVRIGQLLWLHLFLGLVVLGPVCLKLGSTGYRCCTRSRSSPGSLSQRCTSSATYRRSLIFYPARAGLAARSWRCDRPVRQAGPWLSPRSMTYPAAWDVAWR
jgi:hypothetical protein